VSLPYANKIRQQLLLTGVMERIPQVRYGPVSQVTAKAEHLLRERIGKARMQHIVGTAPSGAIDQINQPAKG
jgi:hypothetical protein